MWYLSIAYAISLGELKFEELTNLRKDYKQSQKYKKFIKRNPNHNEKLKHMMQEYQMSVERLRQDNDDLTVRLREVER
jgi:septal ring factor EnvC (AmiA/AmiB activator)